MKLNDPKRTTWPYEYAYGLNRKACTDPTQFSHHSYDLHRLKDNPLEAQALQKWIEINKRSDILAYLLSDKVNEAQHDRLSQRDLEVAATLMQWLGSPVGQGFLRDAGLKD
jgi:hypothetical protein